VLQSKSDSVPIDIGQDSGLISDSFGTGSEPCPIKPGTDVSTKYKYTCEPLACEEKDGKTVVTCHLVGNFPGSPVDLRFLFKLEGDKIRRWKFPRKRWPQKG
jgi:hypothetical protein